MTSTQISAIFFVVGVIAVTPVLYYHYRKHPHPRFRPPVGEMVMLSLLALMLIGGGSYFMGSLLSSDPDLRDDPNRGRSGTSRTQTQDQPQQGRSNKKKGSKNPLGF